MTLFPPAAADRVENVIGYVAPCPHGRLAGWRSEYKSTKSEIQSTPQNVTVAWACCDCEDAP